MKPLIRCFGLILAFSLAPTARAQTARADSVSPQMIDQVLEQLKLTAASDGDAFHFTLHHQPTTLRLLEGGARLAVQSRLPGPSRPEIVTRFNDQHAVVAEASLGKDRALLLVAEWKGREVSATALRKFLLSYARDLRELEILLQPAGDKVSAVPLAGLAKDEKAFEVRFPSNDANWETAWKIEWDMETIGAGRKAGMTFPADRPADTVVFFKIKKASFKPGRQAPWVQVLADAHASELYVPYYFRNTRFFDLRDAGEYVPLTQAEGGPRGRTLGEQRLVMAELRDRGVAYKNGAMTRRAEELTLWANFNAGNYTYLIEFGFMDDGTIAFRHAPTGYNLPSDHFANHMHNCCWRIGMHLGLEGKIADNAVAVVRWPGSTPTAPNVNLDKANFGIEPLKFESFRDWDPKEFTKIRVSNPGVTLNEPGGPNARPISYDLVPMVQGIARHGRPDESFSKHDFWVTRADSPINQYIHLGTYFGTKKPRPLGGNGVVLWHMSSALHVPRSEDGILKGSSITNGQALATWTVVELRPRNLFSSTPIYRGIK